MHKLVIGMLCATLLACAAQTKKPYFIHGGGPFHILFVVYDGPLLPRASTAVLVTAGHTTIATIDGQSIDNDIGPNGLSNVAQFMPGKHVIGIGYLDLSVHSTYYMEVAFDAQSGHVYLADASADIKHTWTGVQGKWDSKITDITAELGEQDNYGLDQTFKSGNGFIRMSEVGGGKADWLQNRIP